MLIGTMTVHYFVIHFLHFLRCFRTHRRLDSYFLLINLATRSTCYLVCFFVCVMPLIGSEMHQMDLKAGFSRLSVRRQDRFRNAATA